MNQPTRRITTLIETGHTLRTEWEQQSIPEPENLERAVKTARWVQSSEHFLGFVGLEAFREQFNSTYKSNTRPPYKYAMLVGILESARDEIANGFLGRLVYVSSSP